MTALRRVLRTALHSLRRSPGFTSVAIGSLALALGLVSTVIGFVDAFRHPRTATDRPEQLYTIFYRGAGASGTVTAADHAAALERYLTVADGIAYYSSFQGTAIAGTTMRRLNGAHVTENTFALLGVKPLVGRLFDGLSDDPSAQDAIVIDEDLWYSLFHGDRRLERLALTVGDRRYQVIGVVPNELKYELWASAWLLLPRAATGASAPAAGWPNAIVRLRDGVTMEALRQELQGITRFMTAAHGPGPRGFTYQPRPVKNDPTQLGQLHWVLLIATGAVLLIACANLANLVLARGLQRQRDLAVRLSVGARRIDIVGEVIAECALLALAGTAVGMFAASWGFDLARSRMPEHVAEWGALALDMNWRVAALSALAALVAAVTFGLFPALRLSEIDLADHLKTQSGSTTARHRDRYSVLVVTQVALTLTLLTGSALLAKASQRLKEFDYGFDAGRLLEASAWLYRMDTSRADAILQAIETRLAALPQAQAVTWTATMPGAATGELPSGGTRTTTSRGFEVVSPNYLQTLGIPVVRGRDFEPADALGLGAVIVDEQVAQMIWGPDDPVGRLIKLGRPDRPSPWMRVVGVAKHVDTDPSQLEASPPRIYMTGPQAPRHRSFLVRASPADHAALAVEMHRVMDVLPPGHDALVWPFDEGRRELLRLQTFLSGAFATFGVAALMLCAVGLYGVLSYAVHRRTREYGIRMAIGASSRDIFRGVVREGTILVLAGTALGAFGSFWTNRLVDRYIQGLYHIDAPSLVLAEALLMTVALVAIGAPAWRATRSNPVDALRAV